MEAGENFPPSIDLERKLEVPEIVEYRQRVIIPAFNFLWRRKTIETAKYGDVYSEAAPPEGAAKPIASWVDARFERYFSQDMQTYEEVLELEIGLTVPKSPMEIMTPQIHERIKQTTGNEDLIDAIFDGDCSLWLDTKFCFVRDDNEDPVYVTRDIDVQDKLHDTVWSASLGMLNQEPEITFVADEEGDMDVVCQVCLNDDELSAFTSEDLIKVGIAFDHLGVPSDITQL